MRLRLILVIAIALMVARYAEAETTAIGSIGGALNVSETGAATYTIPIDVPQGINGMQPSVALTYNSHGGDGVCGIGFSVAATSVITRTMKDIYHDGVASGIRYDSDGVYALDGMRLVVNSGGQLCPENSPFDIVTKEKSGFKVELQNGNTAYYGQNYESRASANMDYYAWYLDKVVDSHGNTITYTYTRDNECVYLKQISYGVNTVDFSYEGRTDVIPYTVNGSRREIKKRLKTIQTSTNGALRNTYTLSYTNDNYFSQLVGVTARYGSTTLPEVTFKYGEKRQQAAPTKSIIPATSVYTEIDINGDGLTDVVEILPNKVEKYLAQRNGGTVTFKKETITTDCAKAGKETTTQGDMNGDGRNDLILVTNNQAAETIKRQGDGVYSVNVGKDEATIEAGDFFDEGKSGLLYFKKDASGKTQCKLQYLKEKDGTKTLSGQLTMPRNTQAAKVGDFDGDGMVDLFVAGSTEYAIFWNRGVASTVFPFSDKKVTTGSSFGAGDILDYGDFDGDGLTDILLLDDKDSKPLSDTEYKISYKMRTALNRGRGTFTINEAYSCVATINNPLLLTDVVPMTCKVFDFDNDGKDDLLFETLQRYGKENNYGRYFLKSDGTKFTKQKENASGISVGEVLMGDFDGDGYAELMAGSSDMMTGGGKVLSQYMYMYDSEADHQTYRLTEVSEANNGARTTIEYSTLCDGTVYTRGSGSKYPLVDVTMPLSVVSQTNSEVAGSTYGTQYRYGGMRVHRQGLGNLGFTTFEVNNHKTGARQTTTVKSLDEQYYEPSRITTTTTQGGKTSTVETTRAFLDKGGKSRFAYTANTVSTDIYGDVTTTTNSFDGNGNLTKQRKEYGSKKTNKGTDNGEMYNQTKYEYVEVGGVYRPQKVTVSQKHADDSYTYSRTTAYEYDSIGNVIIMTENADDVDKWPIVHEYTYDKFGNVLTHKQTADDVPEVTTYREYDSTNRFVSMEWSSANSIRTSNAYDVQGRLIETICRASGKNLITNYEYDDLGNVTEIIHPDETRTTFIRGWGDSAQRRYFVTEKGTASAPVTKWYDNAGREVETSTKGEKDVTVTSMNTYNDTFGTVARTTKTVGELSLTDSYTYNDLGLLSMAKYCSGGYAKYEYPERRMRKTTINGRETTTTFDYWGGVKSVTEGGVTSKYTYLSNGNPTSVKCGRAETKMIYGVRELLEEVIDPNSGRTRYEYDALGRVVKQTDARGNVMTNEYDASGLLTKQKYGYNKYTDYTYTSTQKLSYIGDGVYSNIRYTYDKYDRMTKKAYTVHGTGRAYTYTYNDKGQVVSKRRPQGVTEEYEYDDNGNVTAIKVNGTTVWELTSYTGRKRTMALGYLTMTKEYSEKGRLVGSSMSVGSQLLHSMSYKYDDVTGNMTQRRGMTTATETFSYDSFDRLTAASCGGETKKVEYENNGNIAYKTGVGNYSYNKAHPYAVSQITDVGDLIRKTAQSVSYNEFNKASRVTIGETTLDIFYNHDRQRSETTYTDGKNTITTIYAGEYEYRSWGLGNDKNVGWNYIYSPDGDLVAICLTRKKVTTIYHVETDHLGSIVRVYDNVGSVVFSAEYDAWGKRTVKKNDIGLRRGYCQHEHWDEFDLIDMNGRMYDPTVGRFLSPDPYVQDGTNPQNFNRYSYCLNNPLKYTDPSGYEYRDTPRRDEDMAMIEDDEYWSLAEHVRDYIFSGSSGGGMSFNWGNSSRKREKLDVKTLLSTYLLENFWNDLSRILSEISQQEGFDWSKVAIGVETIVGQSTASGVKVEATGILGSVMFLGGDDAGYVYQYYGGEVGAGVETSVGASVSVGKSYFVAYNYTANNAHYEFDGDYSYINVSAGWSIPGFELGFVGSLSYAKGKHWLVISESVEATAGVGVSTGFTGGITAGGGHITFINKENVGKPKSLYQIFFR